MNSQGDVENEDALFMIQQRGMDAFPFDPNQPWPLSYLMRPPGPHAVKSFSQL
jgi:hypothetical protein